MNKLPLIYGHQMSKKERIKKNKNHEIGFSEPDVFIKKEFVPLTKAQKDYWNAIDQNIITISVGAAGTGKSYVAIAYAADELIDKRIHKIVFTRAGVECGENYGFLPGELDEKLEPYYLPIKDTLKRILGSGNADYFIRRKIIEFRPLAFMRGSTFQDSIIILDEAQNLTPVQMKMFLTRIGENCKVIINGDMTQQDIKGMSGLMDAVKRLRGIRRVAIIEFSLNDVVRSGIVKDILRAYS